MSIIVYCSIDCSKAHYCTDEIVAENFSVQSPQPTFLQWADHFSQLHEYVAIATKQSRKRIPSPKQRSKNQKEERTAGKQAAYWCLDWEHATALIMKSCGFLGTNKIMDEQDHVSMCSLLPWFRASLYTRDDARLVVFIRGSVPDSIPCDLILGISQNELDFVTDLFSKFQFMW